MEEDAGEQTTVGTQSEGGTRRSYIYESEDIPLEPGLVFRTKQEIELRERFAQYSFNHIVKII